MKARKILVSLAALALVAAISIGGTLAYLTSQDTVSNTFTVGNIKITLDEADITNPTGKRVASNQYKIYPGQTYTKDPTVTILAGSEDCYVRMLVEVESYSSLLKALPKDKEAYKDFYNGDVFLLEKLCSGWDPTVWKFEKVTTDTTKDTATYEFRYYEVVKNSDKNQVLDALFDTITVPGTVDNGALANLGNVKINVIGNAMQKEGFTTADLAWDKF